MRSCSPSTGLETTYLAATKKADTPRGIDDRPWLTPRLVVVHATTRGHRRWGLLFGLFGHHRFGRDQQARDRGGVLQCQPYDLGRVDDAGFDHVDVLEGLRVEAAVGVVGLEQLPDHDRPIGSRVFDYLANR